MLMYFNASACDTPLLNKAEQEKYKETIAWTVDNEITNQTSETTSGKTYTRAEIVTFLWRAVSKGLI